MLIKHFRGGDVGELVGLHTTSVENTCRWIAVDIDHHGAPDRTREKLNEAAAHAIAERLSELGLDPLLLGSNCRGGFHILSLFERPIPAETAYRFGRWLVRDWQSLHLAEAPETFPKQPRLEGGRLGNWLRLPGLQHTDGSFSRAWDGKRWQSGAAAVELILAKSGASPSLIPAAALTGPEPVAPPPSRPRPRNVRRGARPIERVLDELDGVRPCGDGFLACCPAHDDHAPSLSVREALDGKVLLHCHAHECDVSEIVFRLGLSMLDLYPTRSEKAAAGVRDRQVISVPADLPDFSAEHSAFRRAITPGQVRELAERLGVPSESLRALEVGWSRGRGCWTFPERDARRNVVGIVFRYRNGHKEAIRGGKRGLYLPHGWEDRAGPVYVVEGASDTAAMQAMGHAAVGRPSASGGVRFLADLFANEPRPIVILGENDRKPDGRWPGQTGAQTVAAKLADQLGREIGAFLPPPDCKDMREWYTRKLARHAE